MIQPVSPLSDALKAAILAAATNHFDAAKTDVMNTLASVSAASPELTAEINAAAQAHLDRVAFDVKRVQDFISKDLTVADAVNAGDVAVKVAINAAPVDAQVKLVADQAIDALAGVIDASPLGSKAFDIKSVVPRALALYRAVPTAVKALAPLVATAVATLAAIRFLGLGG